MKKPETSFEEKCALFIIFLLHKPGQLKMIYCSKSHFRKKNMEKWPINKLQQNCWIGMYFSVNYFFSV